MPIGWPWSRVSSSASSSAFRSISSPILQMSCARAAGASERHAPPGRNASRARATAASTSAALASGTSAMTSPVAGSIVSSTCAVAATASPSHVVGDACSIATPASRRCHLRAQRLRVSARLSGAVAAVQLLRAVLGRREAVGVAEEPAQVGGVRQAPAGADARHRLVPPRRIREVATASLEPPLPDPARDRGAVVLEEPVEVPLRHVHCGRDLTGRERRVAEVRLRVRMRAEEELGPRRRDDDRRHSR